MSEPMCRCYGCNKLFPESQIARGRCHAEYGESSVDFEASPCCLMEFWNVDEDEVNE